MPLLCYWSNYAFHNPNYSIQHLIGNVTCLDFQNANLFSSAPPTVSDVSSMTDMSLLASAVRKSMASEIGFQYSLRVGDTMWTSWWVQKKANTHFHSWTPGKQQSPVLHWTIWTMKCNFAVKSLFYDVQEKVPFFVPNCVQSPFKGSVVHRENTIKNMTLSVNEGLWHDQCWSHFLQYPFCLFGLIGNKAKNATTKQLGLTFRCCLLFHDYYV